MGRLIASVLYAIKHMCKIILDIIGLFWGGVFPRKNCNKKKISVKILFKGKILLILWNR